MLAGIVFSTRCFSPSLLVWSSVSICVVRAAPTELATGLPDMIFDGSACFTLSLFLNGYFISFQISVTSAALFEACLGMPPFYYKSIHVISYSRLFSCLSPQYLPQLTLSIASCHPLLASTNQYGVQHYGCPFFATQSHYGKSFLML